MKKIKQLSFLLLLFLSRTVEAAEIRISVYDSLIAKGGLGQKAKPLFEKKHPDCQIKYIPVGDGGQLLNRLASEKEKSQIVWGLDQNLWPQAKVFTEHFGKRKPKGFSHLQKFTQIDEEGFLPYDYGVFTWMADTQELKRLNLNPPHSLSDLKKKIYRKKFIIEDPRTSTPGLGFLLATAHSFSGKNYDEFWKAIKGEWLSMPAQWTEAYGLFLKNQAPLVWSYTTSEAYHRKNGDGDRYQALKISEGHPLQIEGAALVKDEKRTKEQSKCSENFLDFLISEEIQNLVAETNWMFPARKWVVLPKSFEGLKASSSSYFVQKLDAKESEKLLSRWHDLISSP